MCGDGGCAPKSGGNTDQVNGSGFDNSSFIESSIGFSSEMTVR